MLIMFVVLVLFAMNNNNSEKKKKLIHVYKKKKKIMRGHMCSVSLFPSARVLLWNQLTFLFYACFATPLRALSTWHTYAHVIYFKKKTRLLVLCFCFTLADDVPLT